ncbi:MAG: hypothetical protein AB1352_02070 [Patescibacteria group bacterium]
MENKEISFGIEEKLQEQTPIQKDNTEPAESKEKRLIKVAVVCRAGRISGQLASALKDVLRTQGTSNQDIQFAFHVKPAGNKSYGVFFKHHVDLLHQYHLILSTLINWRTLEYIHKTPQQWDIDSDALHHVEKALNDGTIIYFDGETIGDPQSLLDKIKQFSKTNSHEPDLEIKRDPLSIAWVDTIHSGYGFGTLQKYIEENHNVFVRDILIQEYICESEIVAKVRLLAQLVENPHVGVVITPLVTRDTLINWKNAMVGIGVMRELQILLQAMEAGRLIPYDAHIESYKILDEIDREDIKNLYGKIHT